MIDTDVLAPDVAAWLVARRTPDPVIRHRRHGLSSDALAMHALGLPLKDAWGYPATPHDPDDLLACELTVRSAPERLRLRMQPTLDLWRKQVAERYDLSEMDAMLAEAG